MIQIVNKKDCCGCSACEQICPVGCITMREDSEWFLYPEVDSLKCIGCGMCEKVCPVINSTVITKSHKVFAAKAKDDRLRMTSSSGGIFTLLAEKMIDSGGVVFGAGYDGNWNVVHSWTETKEGLAQYRGSKYVQSRINGAYKDVEMFLKQGRGVLFSGTPCQVSALRLYLRKKYDKLVLVDVACHGVPSPGIWRKYLQEMLMPDRREGREKNTVLSFPKEMPVITGINFRDKNLGWKKYSFVVSGGSAGDGGQNSVLLSDMHKNNPYMCAFLSDLSLRPSCYDCKSKLEYSGSDITIADYWGISVTHPELDDNCGVSLVVINTKEGEEFFEGLQVDKKESELGSAIKYNPCIIKSAHAPSKRNLFWNYINQGATIDNATKICLHKSFLEKVYVFVKKVFIKIEKLNN